MGNYYDKELQPLLTLNNKDIKPVKVKFISDKYTTKWLNINLDSIESIQAFLEILKEDLEK